jgi:hypothetical protein
MGPALALVVATAGWAVPPPPAPARFPAKVDVVKLSVLVTGRGRPITGLEASDFEVQDDGVAQKVEQFSAEERSAARGARAGRERQRARRDPGPARARLRRVGRPPPAGRQRRAPDLRERRPADRSRSAIPPSCAQVSAGWRRPAIPRSATPSSRPSSSPTPRRIGRWASSSRTAASRSAGCPRKRCRRRSGALTP